MAVLRTYIAASVLCIAAAPISLGAQNLLLASLPDAPSFQQQQKPAPVNSDSAAPQKETEPQADQVNEDKQIPEAQETEEQRREELHEEAEKEVREEEKQRVAGVMPGFNIVMNGKAVPLTPKEKFSLVLHSISDPYYFGISGVGAGLSELTGSHEGYGWGPAGYFKRFGAAYADNADGALLGNAVLPILWHQDPRYFRKGSGSVGSRILNAAMSNFICRGDNGKKQFNYSNIVGNLMAGGISNLYYPAEERGVGLVFQSGLTVTAYGLVGAQLLEFGPDLTKLLHRKRDRNAAPLAQPSSAIQPQSSSSTTK